jgi:pimeloyl-ACP methyl ester carboxylesterase
MGQHGSSPASSTPCSKRWASRTFTLVGQDVGGLIAYSYLRTYDDVARVLVMDVLIPGVDPWDDVLRNPYLWHFAMHAIPALPELLTQGRQGRRFQAVSATSSAKPAMITSEARSAYVDAYGSDSALTAGFNWYRAFGRDADDNRGLALRGVASPLLYVRGELESGDINDYVEGLRSAGISRLEHALVPGAGHLTQEKAPVETWGLIAAFVGS